MQNPTQNLDKTLYFSRNKVFCLKNGAPTTIQFKIFVEIFHTFPTYQYVQMGVRDLFQFI